MVTLVLLRHAKSSWSDAELDDRDRPLAKRGTKAIPAIARYMQKEGIQPRRCPVFDGGAHARHADAAS